MSTAKRILIVTSGNPCRNPRAVKEAATLTRAGYEVALLSPTGSPVYAQTDRELSQQEGYRHLIAPAPGVLTRRVRQWLARRAIRLGVESIWSLGYTPALEKLARAHAADLTIVHNEVPHWIGLRLLALGRRVAADIEDWHSEDLLPTARRHRPLRLLRASELALLHRARYVSTTSESLAHALHERYGGQRPSVITNAFPLQPAPVRASRESEPSFFWFSQTLGPGRGLEAFLDAWKHTTRPSRLVLLGEPCDGYEVSLRALLPEAFRARLSFLSLVSPSALPGVIAQHDIGLALEENSIASRDLTITNKILQYLNAGLAIVASDTAGQREVLRRSPDCGIIARRGDAAHFAAQLDELLSQREKLAARQAAARALAESHYCWELETPRLLALAREALA